ncbi:uncharacterized protein LOC109811505 [Cajanus cajan]|uniref:uncharacterized protein LOC109811505 n=1 Tax=Cajanus cajan TaxID=3821 RepID=UPI00098D9E5B|nr:uncharacterized protein LOC109811505 [Cajanus cajan]
MEIHYKLFMGTLKKAALDWFSGLPDRSVTDFDVFSQLFMAQFVANKRKPPITSDMFDLKQQREELLKDFLQRFNEVALRIASLDERMAVITFQKGLRSGKFDVAQEKVNCQMMSEVRAFALSHIKMEAGQINKRVPENREAGVDNKEDNKHLHARSDWSKRQDRYNVKEGNHRQADYGGRTKGEWARNNEEKKFTPLNVPRRQILQDVNSASLFEFSAAMERQLGPFKTDWCEFHRTHGHTTKNYFVLGRQIERLIKEERLKKFVARKHEEGSSERGHRHAKDGARRDRHKERSPQGPPTKVSEVHQQPIHGDFNTVARGFAGRGLTSAARKTYTRSVLTISEFWRPPQPKISFSDSDYEGVTPHEDDPIVISEIVMGYNVKRVLVDQGSSTDILFWKLSRG